MPMKNMKLAFGVAGELPSAYQKIVSRKRAQKSSMPFKNQNQVGQPFPTRLHLVVGQPYCTWDGYANFWAILL